MLTADRELVSLRTSAILPIVFFLPPLVSFAVAPGAVWAEYPGILFHLAILVLIARLDAPEWARAAGYGWIVIDVVTGVLVINEVPEDITWPIRLGGHVLAGVWMIAASLLAESKAVRVVGVVVGSWLALYSFGSHYLPRPFLYPASILTVVWLGLLAAFYRPVRRVETTAR
ncbi:hypothetical protein [Nocardia sp. CS682]|uniref:hypothetical protein n=1 Tax=Nocardia sp. CS682 TaxID=1047172 RepID=UPI001074CD03|nr:hypothetical protein [Nocardia sp. CS682]QBS39302.1 hypothetical protein DMB37_03375 [Nocardia sp. CS682]